ncbi:hypothetical protein CF149_02439 [Pseudomonas psychrophila]|nr:hypothetical protein CF149_02439 [Pseudomonas psychrophila]
MLMLLCIVRNASIILADILSLFWKLQMFFLESESFLIL